jgi:hypothetical protein
MQVFISHAAADRALAEGLIAEFEKAGIEVWDPYRSLFPGDNWALAVGKALEASAVMVVLLTPNARQSPTIGHEVQYALTSGNYGGRVVPVLVNMATFEAGNEVPWILLHLEVVPVEGYPPDFRPVVERVQKITEPECHAAT